MATNALPLPQKSTHSLNAAALPSAEKLLQRFGHLFTAIRLLLVADRMEGLEQHRIARSFSFR